MRSRPRARRKKKGPTPAEVAAARAEADARVLEGCYDCLLGARDTYLRFAAGTTRAAFVQPLFETELLIALREKELAMDPTEAIARAKALVPELPAGVDGGRYLALVENVPADAMGSAEVESSAFRRDHATFVPTVNGEMTWLDTGPLKREVREYLSLAIDCKYPNRPRDPSRPRVLGTREIPPGTSPLIAYRLSTCDSISRAGLEDVKARVPLFVETSAFLARLEVASANKTGGATARKMLDEAYARFSKSPSVTYLSGNLQQVVGVCKDALRFYDETIAIKPLHENALLGRTVCLTFTNRLDEAIDAATHMIDLKTYNMYEAYYWRAWIYHHRQDLPTARRDIESAKHLAITGNISRLAGIIEYDQDEIDTAEKDFNAAKSATDGGSDCVARWYLGMIGNKRLKSNDAAAHFEDAMACYTRAADVTEAGLRQMMARTDIDPDFRARQIEGLTAAVKEDRSQQYASAYNAAYHHVRQGNFDKARTLLSVAANDPALEKNIAELRKIIERGPRPVTFFRS